MKKQKRPEIGTIMWDVHENLYYGKAGEPYVCTEYVVTSAPVEDFFEGGYVELKMCGPVPHGDRSFPMPRFHKLSDISAEISMCSAMCAMFRLRSARNSLKSWKCGKECEL